MLILARTTPLEEVTKPTAGPDAVLHRRSTAATSRCARSRRWAARRSTPTSCSSTACEVPVEDRIGEEGRGFEYILHGINPERILIAAEAVGLGRAALAARRRLRARSASCSAGRSARTRRSSIRSRECWMELEAANLMMLQGGLALRHGPAVRRGGQRREVSRRRGRLQGLRDRGDDARRLRLREGVSTSSATCARA